MKNKIILSAALTASLYFSPSVAADCSTVLVPEYKPPSVATGWSAQLIIQNLKKPRTIEFDSSGNLLVVESGKGISRVTLKDNGGTCLEVDRNILLINNTGLNHGLTLSDDGKTLYASTVDNVYAWTYDAATGTVGANVKTVVANMSNNEHTTRTLMMSRKQPGKLVVSRGSDENYDVDALNIGSGLSQIKMFNLNELEDSKSYNFNSDGTVLGWGLRNSVGVAEEPKTGGIYSVETSIDDITRSSTDIHEDNPGEELNFHGYLNGSTEDQGGNYGYPVCYAVWDTNIPDAGSLAVGDQFSPDPANDTACAKDYVAPRLTFQAHTSPLNLIFDSDGSNAYFAFHGSFDRDNPVGYTLSSTPFADGAPTAPSNSKDSLTHIMSNPDMGKCPDNCFRPVGLAWDAQGRLWMTSDSTGEIYVLQKSQDGASGTATTSGTISTSTSEAKNVGARTGIAGTVVGVIAVGVAALVV